MGMFTYPARQARLASPAGQATDLAVTALVLSVAAMAWFGWGSAEPPASWSPALVAGSAASVATVLAAGAATWRHRGAEPSMHDRAVRRAYGRIVAAEAAACVLGAAALTAGGEPAYLPAWILLVVGAHFLPLGRLFRITELYPAGLALGVIAVAAAVTGTVTTVHPSAVAGAGGGLTCLIAALSCVRRSRPAALAEGRP
jgi:hypothetical protein